MAIIPKITSALGQQVRGAVVREGRAVRSGTVLGQVGRTVDLRAGGLLTAGKDLLGIASGPAGQVGNPVGTVAGGQQGAALNITDLPQWGGLSPHLLAAIYPCDSKGNVPAEGGDVEVKAPATEVQFESTLNWQSPFENSGPESKAPTIMALLQTGQIATVANALQAAAPEGAFGDFMRDLSGKAESWARSLEGRTGITKLNSRQVFSGMPPIRITLQLHLRAVTDPVEEVIRPYEQLLKWAFPQKLAPNGIISEVISSDEGLIRAMFPSLAPQMVGFRYGNNRFSPMVIESVANPLDGPMDSAGRPIYRNVQLTLATLEALDTNDVDKLFTRS